MLKRLQINNIILVESAILDLTSGLNILSGETGSGKSAIMNSISLIAGEKSDVGMIRRGCEKGVVEALFDIEALPSIYKMLKEANIEHEPGEELIIRREIHISGKSRAFINNQTVQVSLLRQIGELLINIAGQHANRWLLAVDKHREILDHFGDLDSLVHNFSKSWQQENALRCELELLINQESQRLREIEVCRMELEELENAHIKDGEDEELFAEYALLTSAEERATRASEIAQVLSGEKVSVMTLMNRLKSVFDQLGQIDTELDETAKSFENCRIELQEIAYTMRNYMSRIDHNPERAAKINERMTLLARLKRKYGSTIEEIQAYLQQTREKLELLENADVRIEELQKALEELSSKNNHDCLIITQKRKTTAKIFEQQMVEHLRALNMPKVEFHVEISAQKRNGKGDDAIEFFLTPNVGEHKISIRDCASGGELSRLMLAVQTLLSGQGQTPVLIFDEIDANIGGETATVVGNQLKAIGKQCQVLCITHFPQVAAQADRHFQISKKEDNGRTLTSVRLLEGESREEELARMLGGSLASAIGVN